MKYPGAKTSLIPDIVEVFRKSGMRKLIDVFGGSGTVLLNVKAPVKIYNDLDSDMANVFSVLKRKPNYIYSRLSEAVRNGEFDSGRRRRDPPRNPSRPGNDEERAYATLSGFMKSFGGMGNTYNTREKSTRRYAINILQKYNVISSEVATWTIESMDFRDLVSRYDGPGSFFYLDPPYFEKNWYNHNFRVKDYEDLAGIMAGIKGTYLMNIDAVDDELTDIFGTPDFVKRYENQNQNVDTGTRPPRLKAFYTNI